MGKEKKRKENSRRKKYYLHNVREMERANVICKAISFKHRMRYV